jgi:acyl carrier protein/seryl-tRNA synthetase
MFDAAAFERRLLGWLHAASPSQPPPTRDTPLFGHGLIDSLRSVELVLFVERELGRPIPESLLSMEHFRSVADIVRAFSPDASAQSATAMPVQAFGDPLAPALRDGVQALARSGELRGGADGFTVLSGRALELHTRFSALFARLAADEGAEARRYPTLLPVADLQRTDYYKSFPQHASFCGCLAMDEAQLRGFVEDVQRGEPVTSAAAPRLAPPTLALGSAVCYHCYREFAGRTLPPGLTVLTAEGRCFRNERGDFRALDRGHEFTMREIVMMGGAAAVESRRQTLVRRVVALAGWLGLSGTVESATDMFFGGDAGGRARRLRQQAQALKLELRAKVDAAAGDTLAIASFNLHEDYFGRAFCIRLDDGTPATTGCVAFGIERWISAFLSRHGADPAHWPDLEDPALTCAEGARA